MANWSLAETATLEPSVNVEPVAGVSRAGDLSCAQLRLDRFVIHPTALGVLAEGSSPGNSVLVHEALIDEFISRISKIAEYLENRGCIRSDLE